MADRMKFRFVQGFRERIVREVDAITTLRAAMVAVDHTPALEPLARAVLDSLVEIHNILQRMTGVGDLIPEDQLPDNVADVRDVKTNAWFTAELAFVRGVVHDEFLAAGDTDGEIAIFQQGAVLNLRKARFLMNERFQTMVRK